MEDALDKLTGAHASASSIIDISISLANDIEGGCTKSAFRRRFGDQFNAEKSCAKVSMPRMVRRFFEGVRAFFAVFTGVRVLRPTQKMCW